MKNVINLSLIWILFFSAMVKNSLPDLSKKEDLIALGVGRIIEKDKSVITKITLQEVNEYGIIYIKNESLHDFAIESIDRIEFLSTPWGPLEIRFKDGKPQISLL